MLDSAAQIWTFLQVEGGLDLDFHADMDGEIVRGLCAKLGLADMEDIESELERQGTSVEQFVEAFLTALGPYSTMMQDLLVMFERAGGTTTDHAMHVHFDFDQELDLDFDIRHFRDWTETFSRIRTMVEATTLNNDTVWVLFQLLRRHAPNWNGIHHRHLRDTAVERWLYEYQEIRRWPDFYPDAPTSGDAELDELLARVHAIWRDVVAAARSAGPTREDLRGAWDRDVERTVNGWPLNMIASMDSDLWPGSVLDGMYAAARESRPGRAAPLANALREFFDGLPKTNVERETLERTLLEFLNLPIWKRRYELYSAWIATQILEAVAAYEPRIHVRDGTISFAFGGSHLATCDRLRPAVHLWAELRSPVDATLTGLEKHIQPDYTLIADPITEDRSAVVVIECKQYRRESRRNFGHAVHKYAIGRPNAEIILVNYGPARTPLLAGLPLTDEQQARIHIFGHVRPGAPVLVDVWEKISSALAKFAADVAVPKGLRSIELSWTTDIDLDLWLLLEDHHAVSFKDDGGLDDHPWAALDGDRRFGGTETITFARTLPLRYRCFVHNYDTGREFPDDAQVTVVNGGTPIRISIPNDGQGRFWHVFDYDGASGAIAFVNRICESEPSF